MRKIALLLFCYSILSLSVSAQVTEPVDSATTAINEEDKIFEKVEIEATFSGGETAWRKFLEKNINAATPVEYGAPAGTYTVIVQFVVDKEGNISDVRAFTHHGFGMENEVVRLIRKAPHWNPAIQDGRPVKAYRKQPVTFSVTEEKSKRKNKRT